MSRRTLLFIMNTQTTDAYIHDVAERAVRKGYHLFCLLVDVSPALPAYAYGTSPYGGFGGMEALDNWQETMMSAQNAQKARANEIENVLAKTGVSAQVSCTIAPLSDIKHYVARCARVSDEALLAQNFSDSAEAMREAICGILFHSPIGVQVNAALNGDENYIFVAWDNSEAASAAVHAALPKLKAAQEVVIGCIDPAARDDQSAQDPGADVATWLSHHGCNVTVSQFPSGGRATSDCIQDRARELGADLVVMGGYGHARMLQAVFGGTTRSLLEQTGLSVFLAH